MRVVRESDAFYGAEAGGGGEEISVLWCFFNLLGILIPIDQDTHDN